MSDTLRVESASLSDALARILTLLPSDRPQSESVALDESLGRTLARDLLSPIDVPAYTNSAMDGYAFRGEELSGEGTLELTVAGESLAGHPCEHEIPPGSALHVMTGGLVPEELDTVIPFEKVEEMPGRIRFARDAVKPGANVRHKGEELRAGDAALRRGERITPAHVGLAASLGYAELPVERVVRAAVFATGDEVREPGRPLGEGELYNANGHSLTAQLRAWGADVTNLGILPDDPDRMEAVLREAACTHDLLLTSGGVGAGEKDFTARVLARLGTVTHLHVAMRPGKPLTFGTIEAEGRRVLFLGLPGNPVAALLSARLFVRPVLDGLAGSRPVEVPLLRATAATNVRSRPGRTEFVRGTLERRGEELFFTPYATQSSALLTTLTECNACALIEETAGSIPAGRPVDVFFL